MLTPDLIGRVPVIIVAFRNHDDVLECLAALAHVNRATPIEIYICENGGATAYERLIQVLTAEGGPLEEVEFRAEFPRSQVLVATATFGMKGNSSPSGLRVHVGCAKENLGYAGGINSWLKPLADVSGWPGAWVLNPDTEPEPRALAELIIFADRHKRGMVGSRLIETGKPHLVRTRGLAWKKWLATVRAVDKGVPVNRTPPIDVLDREIDAPSGASIYVTRQCLGLIGLMNEEYFLYMEDLEWGLRAKKLAPVGYAHSSIVAHKGGTTIGGSTVKRKESQLSVYLGFRNRVLFVRNNFPLWLPWTVLLSHFHVIRYFVTAGSRNGAASLKGLYAGLLGRTGRPDHILRAHLKK